MSKLSLKNILKYACIKYLRQIQILIRFYSKNINSPHNGYQKFLEKIIFYSFAILLVVIHNVVEFIFNRIDSWFGTQE